MTPCPSPFPVRRNVRIVLMNDLNQILLMNVKLPDRTFWCTLGGGIEGEETPQEAAIRELFEESGLSHKEVDPGPLIWEGEHMLDRKGVPTLHREFFFLFKTTASQIRMDHMTDEEKIVVKELRWWSLDEIESTSEFIVPPILAELLTHLIREGPPSKTRLIELGDG